MSGYYIVVLLSAGSKLQTHTGTYTADMMQQAQRRYMQLCMPLLLRMLWQGDVWHYNSTGHGRRLTIIWACQSSNLKMLMHSARSAGIYLFTLLLRPVTVN